MTIKFIDFHSHNNKLVVEGVLSLPTFRLAMERIPDSVEKFWIGVHPWDSNKIEGDIVDFIKSYGDRVVGIGEIGLDYYYNSDDINIQKSIFKLQIDYAITAKKPVTIHCVRAYNDLISILKEKKEALPKVIIHGFIGSVEILKELLALDCYISYGKASFSSPKTINSLKSTPIDRLFLESDDDNEVDIKELYFQTASIIAVDKDTLKKQLFKNYITIING